ncbi:MAG TPA: hypothetical protein VJA21_01925 [Verrucomicrobiae bacterium]
MKKHGLDTCAECSDSFKCPIFLRRKVAEWIPAARNLHRIKKAGLERWLREQEERRALLEELLRDYNEGRSMNLFCKVCARMPIGLITKAIAVAEATSRGESVDESDPRSRARVLRTAIVYLAAEGGISLN